MMPKAVIDMDTFLKKRIAGANELADSEKVFLQKGKEFFVTEFVPDRSQHLRLVLASPMLAKDGKNRLTEVFAYAPHVAVEGEEATQRIRLPVVYRSQLDNDPSIFGPGWRQCNTTSNTMLADYLLKGELAKKAKELGLPEPESLFMRIVAKYGDTTDHDAQTRALSDLGIESYFSHTLSSVDLMKSLKANVPVVVGFAYKNSGHICVVVGHDPLKKAWLIHDPYGIRFGTSDSYDIGANGAYDSYTYSTMQQIFWDQGRESGWGRVVTSVKGKSTGLPQGL